MKTRKKKRRTKRVERVRVPTLELIELRDVLTIADVDQDVEGKIVKVSPLIPSSERENFDGAALAQAIREKGALAVLMAPRIVSDTVQPERKKKSIKPRELVKEWFEAQHSIFSDAAEEMVLDAMEAEGM